MPQSPTTPLAAFTTGPFTAPATTNSQQSDYFSGAHHLNSPATSPTTPPGNSSNKTAEGENSNNNGNNTSASTTTNSSVVTTTIQPPPPAFVNQNTNNSASISFMNKFKHSLIRGGKISRNDGSKAEETSNNGGSNTSNSKNTTTISSNEPKQRQSQEENTTQKQQTNDDTAAYLSSSHDIPTPTLYHHPHLPHHYYPIRQMHPLIQPPFVASPNNETPELQIPQHTTVIISEESHEASTSVDLYRGTIDDMERDAEIIEQKAPTWLIEFLIKVGEERKI
jgi:WD repeat-containing protein 48